MKVCSFQTSHWSVLNFLLECWKWYLHNEGGGGRMKWYVMWIRSQRRIFQPHFENYCPYTLQKLVITSLCVFCCIPYRGHHRGTCYLYHLWESHRMVVRESTVLIAAICLARRVPISLSVSPLTTVRKEWETSRFSRDTGRLAKMTR